MHSVTTVSVTLPAWPLLRHCQVCSSSETPRLCESHASISIRACLNHGIQRPWMHSLSLPDTNPWQPNSHCAVQLHQWKSRFTENDRGSTAAYM